MACALTAGYTPDCKDSVGGSSEVYVIEKDNATLALTANVVTTITNDASKRWWKYTLPKDVASATETINANATNGTLFYGQEVKFSLNKMLTATRNELHLLAQNRLWIIVKDNNGKYWFYGYQNGMDISAGTVGTGAAKGDRNGYSDITFVSDEPQMAYEVNTALIADLETAGS
jgi:hypothetical protein